MPLISEVNFGCTQRESIANASNAHKSYEEKTNPQNTFQNEIFGNEEVSSISCPVGNGDRVF